MILKTIAAAAAFTLTLAASPALAQTTGSVSGTNGPLPYEKWDATTRSMFFNDDMSIRADEDIRTRWNTISPDRQAAMRLDCENAFPNPGSSDLTEVPSNPVDNPVPGVLDQLQVCNVIRTQ